jgi:hypothetical protein
MSKHLHTLTDHCFPVRIVFPATKKAYRALMKDLDLKPMLPDSAGRMECFTAPGKQTVLAIWISKEAEKRSAGEVLGLIVHECMHVVQYTERAMGTKFDDETACYFMQKLVMWAQDAYAQSGRGFAA